MDARGLIASCLVGASLTAPAQAQAPNAGPDCARVSAGVRMQAYGYAHVVTLANQCQRVVTCEVWTNVDPTPHHTLRAKPGEAVEIVTRNGSPAREVQASKQCRYAEQS